MATEKTWETILRTNSADLLVLIDTESGLEGAVKALGLGTNLQRKNIWGVKDNTIKRNERLLEFLRKGDFERFKIFCEALVKSGQQPIVTGHLSEIKETWNSCSTDGSSDPRSCIALKESYRDCLRQNWNYLVERIDNLNEIEAQLNTRVSLTTHQQRQLQDFREDVDKVCFLLRLLENGSQKLFDDFCEILKSTKKHDLVVTLTPSDAQRALDEVKTTFLEVKLEPPSDIERQRKLRDIESGDAYPVSNGVVKGRVLIFSNRYFVKPTLKQRNGTEYDEANLSDFFKQKLKFKTDIYTDKTSQEIREQLNDEANKYMGDVDVFVVFFMSHGKNGEIYGLDGEAVRTSEIVDLLCCPQLVGKPKLIFIQACRNVCGTEGLDETDGLTSVHEMNNLTLNDADPEVKTSPTPNDAIPEVTANPASNDAIPEVKTSPAPNDAIPEVTANPASNDAIPEVKTSPAPNDAIPEVTANRASNDAIPEVTANPAINDAVPEVKALPTYHPKADMAIFYATVRGDPSYRREEEGSFFVRLLLDVFTRKAHTEDVLTMVTEALRLVHRLQERQLGEQKSSLLRKVYLVI